MLLKYLNLFILLMLTPVLIAEEKKEQILINRQMMELQPEETTALKITRVTMWSAAAADLASTEYGLANAPGDEGNPLMKNRAVRISSKIATAYAIDHFSRQWVKDGHGKRALWLRIAASAIWGAVAGWNISVSW